MNTVQAWTRTGKGPWTQVQGMSNNPRELNAVVQAANAAATGGTQFAVFTTGFDPNN